MLYLFACIAALILGYFLYGTFVERVFDIDPHRPTPCHVMEDGIDYVPMPTWRVYFIQLLNIAGLGPIFGPILGAMYGPAALIWIVIGCIFGGGVHDYFSGMLSVRNDGESIPEIVGDFLGPFSRYAMRFFSVILLVLVGVVFILGPAKLLASLTGINTNILIFSIFIYYFMATILPVDKIIGSLYPFFGALLLFMTVGIVAGLIFHGYNILPNMDIMVNTHPDHKPIWPMIFITISCGAVSGFHSTQSPLMARCIQNESKGRLVFYGAMIMEGVIAIIWATVGLSLYPNARELGAVISTGSPAAVVNQACNKLLGGIGGFLAIMGVIVLPITSGDTAFRSTRLILAESFRISQSTAAKRLIIAIPLFIIAFLMTLQDFNVLWRYFGWSNQVLSMLVLWSAAIYLAKNKKQHWIASLPAMFITAVNICFILQVKIGFGLPPDVSNITGCVASFIVMVLFLYHT